MNAPNIYATCPDCGDIELGPLDITLVSDRARRLESFYRFVCPVITHNVIIIKPADEKIADLLMNVGVNLQTTDFSEAFNDLVDTQHISDTFGPITYDEIIKAGKQTLTQLGREVEFYPPFRPAISQISSEDKTSFISW